MYECILALLSSLRLVILWWWCRRISSCSSLNTVVEADHFEIVVSWFRYESPLLTIWATFSYPKGEGLVFPARAWRPGTVPSIASPSRIQIHQVAAPCSVIRGSGMTCRWIRPNVRHNGILHVVAISITSPKSTCHSAPVWEILFKSDQLWQKKMTSCRFSRWWISAILDFRDLIMGSLKSQLHNFL